MRKFLFLILMAASLVMYSCKNNDDSPPDNNPVDTEFSANRSIYIEAFSSENARAFSTTYKETGCSECNVDRTEFDAILLDKNPSNKIYRYILNIKVSPQKGIKKGDKLTMVGGFFADSGGGSPGYQSRDITGGVTVEEVYKEKDIILSFDNLS